MDQESRQPQNCLLPVLAGVRGEQGSSVLLTVVRRLFPRLPLRNTWGVSEVGRRRLGFTLGWSGISESMIWFIPKRKTNSTPCLSKLS